MTKIVFFGTYLSKQRGHFGPSQTIANALLKMGVSTKLVSSKSTPFKRIIDSIWNSLTIQPTHVVLDIYSTRVIYLSAILVKICCWRKIPYTAVLHGGGIPSNWPKIGKTVSWIINQSASTATPSLYIQEFLAVENIQVKYIPNPINLENFPFQERVIQNAHPKLLWVRAFSSIYQPHLAVKALYGLHQKGIIATLTMIGADLGLLTAIKQLINTLNLTDYIELIDKVPNDQLHVYYHRSNIFLNTTQYESFGLALVEAAATGLPIISTNVGELPYLWKQEHNILFAKNTPESFTDCMLKLLSDTTLYLKLSENAHKNVQAFDIEKIVPQWRILLNCNTNTIVK